MTWFPTMEQLSVWSGPGFRFPFTTESFVEDLKLDSISSYSLIHESKFIGFGQYYERLEHVHLGRLVINPRYRGMGYINALVGALIALGQQQLILNVISLFVLKDNASAISAYQKLGFVHTEYPQPLPMANILYLTKRL